MPHATLQHLLSRDTALLAATLALEPASARIEVQCLLQQVLQVSRAYLHAHAERVLTQPEADCYQVLLQRRLQGEPIAYILGEREFFGLNLKVTPATLIPRPDTELLVELALQRIPLKAPSTVLDLGTGSGAIALAIAQARPRAAVLGCDKSQQALAVAQENAHRLGIANARFVHSDWFAALGDQRFDCIVSNPPYIAAGDRHLTQGDLRHEPGTALVSGVDGLDDIRQLVSHAARHLTAGGWLLLEHGYDQAERVRGLLQDNDYIDIFSEADLGGMERVSGGKLR